MTDRRHVPRPEPRTAPPKGAVHRLALALVWLAVASTAVVFFEPAPADVLMLGLVVLLPVVGLTAIRPGLLAYLGLWLIVIATAFIATSVAADMALAAVHTAVSLYLCIASFIIAAFVARRPGPHLALIVSGYTWAAVIASALAVAGYFDVVPGASELFTLYGRASGAFKDPNVFAPFLILPIVYAVHWWSERPLARALPGLLLLVPLGLGLLLSFSRGGWAALGAALFIYAYLGLVTAETDRRRLRLVALIGCAAVLAAGLLAAASRIDEIGRLLEQRASLDQTYDQGPEGRFGGQLKAVALILDNPLGIGARAFGGFHHHEDPHNTYLAMLLGSGWIGGLAYILLVLVSLSLGLRHAFRRSPTQPAFLAVFATVAALAGLGFVIDTDHWRHFYLVLGLLWGLAIGDGRERRMSRIVGLAGLPRLRAAGHGPRRAGRIHGPARLREAVILPFPERQKRRRRREPRRSARILRRST